MYIVLLSARQHHTTMNPAPLTVTHLGDTIEVVANGTSIRVTLVWSISVTRVTVRDTSYKIT